MFEQNVFAVSAGWAAVVWRGHRGAVDWLVWGWNVTVHAQFVLNWIWKDVTCVAACFCFILFYMLVIDMHRAVDIYFVLTNAADNSSDLLCLSSTDAHICLWILLSLLGIHLLSVLPSLLEIYIAVCRVNGFLCLIAKKLCQKNPNVNLLEMKRWVSFAFFLPPLSSLQRSIWLPRPSLQTVISG